MINIYIILADKRHERVTAKTEPLTVREAGILQNLALKQGQLIWIVYNNTPQE